jgi:hypothetical protein
VNLSRFFARPAAWRQIFYCIKALDLCAGAAVVLIVLITVFGQGRAGGFSPTEE